MLGLAAAILLSVAFAAGNSHVRQTSGHFETKMQQWGEFMPDQYVTDGPSYLQLLEDEKGEWLIRFAYATDGVARRGPVTLRGSDVERLRVALRKTPRLQALLGMGE